MAFKSAELKKLYEQARAVGMDITPQKAARLFAAGKLAQVVEEYIRNKKLIEQAWAEYYYASEEEKRAEKNYETAKKAADKARAMYRELQQQQSTYNDILNKLQTKKYKLQRTQKFRVYTAQKLNALDEAIRDTEERLRHLERKGARLTPAQRLEIAKMKDHLDAMRRERANTQRDLTETEKQLLQEAGTVQTEEEVARNLEEINQRLPEVGKYADDHERLEEIRQADLEFIRKKLEEAEKRWKEATKRLEGLSY